MHVHVITKGEGAANGDVSEQMIADQLNVLNVAYAGKDGQGGRDTAFRFRLGVGGSHHQRALVHAGARHAAGAQAKTALRKGGAGDAQHLHRQPGRRPPRLGDLPVATTRATPRWTAWSCCTRSLPGGAAAPYNLGDTATHEVGHWLGLYHTFQGGCIPPGDSVTDTPRVSEPNFGDPARGSIDSCATPANEGGPSVKRVDSVQNFMDYTDDICMDSFTKDQDLAHGPAVQEVPPAERSGARRAGEPPSVSFFAPAPPPSHPRNMKFLVLAGLIGATVGLSLRGAGADEMSGDDKLRLLYSQRFSFTRRGVPLITVELMHGETEVVLRANRPLRVLPDGDGGPEVRAGAAWTITARDAKPGKARYWTVVSRQSDDAQLALWRTRTPEVRTFETGIVFGVEGALIDNRATLLAVSPEDSEAAAARTAAALAKKWNVETSVHPELVARPQGTLIARAEGATVENQGVLWFATHGDEGLITVSNVLHGTGGSREVAQRETRGYRGRIYVTIAHDGSLAWSTRSPRTSCSRAWCRRRSSPRRRPRR